MTIEEAILHAKEQKEIFGGIHGEFLDVAIEALEEKRKQELKGEKEMKIREAIEMFEKENELLGESEPGVVERNSLAIAALRGERLTCTEINIEEAIEGFKMDNALLCEKQADIITRNNLAIEYLGRNNEVKKMITETEAYKGRKFTCNNCDYVVSSDAMSDFDVDDFNYCPYCGEIIEGDW